MVLRTAMQATFNHSGTTLCLKAFADALCTQANTYILSEIEKCGLITSVCNLITSVCDELALLLEWCTQ